MRTAVIGLGPMGRRHLTAVSRVSALSLVAVADLRADALEGVEVGGGVARFDDAASMLDSAQPDVVVVATTAPSHRRLVESAVAAGARAILCEKPMACSLEDAKAMLDCCQANRVALAVNHLRRHVPAYAWLGERIRSGAWGALRSLHASVPGIGLGCLGTHFIDLMLFLAGRPLSWVAGWVDEPCGANPRGSQFVDPGGLVVGETDGGAKLVLHQIEDGAGPHHVSIHLTGARVLVDERTRSVEMILHDGFAPRGPIRSSHYERVELPSDRPLDLDIIALTADVLEELAGGALLTCDGAHGYRALEAVIAAYASDSRGHVPVTLPITDGLEFGRMLRIT